MAHLNRKIGIPSFDLTGKTAIVTGGTQGLGFGIACALAAYIIENRATVRAAAKKFGVSKSTVHKDLQDRLPQFNRSLYLQVKEVLEVNKAQRHIRGGMATRKKYKGF